MKKIIFIIFAFASVLILTSCGKNINGNEIGSLETSEQVTTVVIETTTAELSGIIETTTTTNEYDCTIPCQTSEENKFGSTLEMLLYNINNNTDISYDGMLYDFDYDEIPELIVIVQGMEDSYCCMVYNLNGDEPEYLGGMSINDIFPIGSEFISSYYDKEQNEYFYCSMPVDFVKNNHDDTGDSYYAELYKYVLVEDKIVEELLFRHMWKYQYPDDITGELNYFYEKCDEILSPYEKIETIPIVPMWTFEDIESGEYENIIREYFEKNGIV